MEWSFRNTVKSNRGKNVSSDSLWNLNYELQLKYPRKMEVINNNICPIGSSELLQTTFILDASTLEWPVLTQLHFNHNRIREPKRVRYSQYKLLITSRTAQGSHTAVTDVVTAFKPAVHAWASCSVEKSLASSFWVTSVYSQLSQSPTNLNAYAEASNGNSLLCWVL